MTKRSKVQLHASASTRTAVTLWEAGRTAPRADMQPRVVRVLGLDVAAIYAGGGRQGPRRAAGRRHRQPVGRPVPAPRRRHGLEAGEVYAWDCTLVEIIQGHTTQQGWIDAMDASLYKAHRAYGVVTDWVQPSGAHDAYNIGEAVRYEGDIYTSLIDANTTGPGWDDRWWELVT